VKSIAWFALISLPCADGCFNHTLLHDYLGKIADAALDLLRRCSPLPAPPAPALSGDRIEFDVPIDYTIRRNDPS
jgi:hypothetical protein